MSARPSSAFLDSRIDPRKLLCCGFLGFAVCSFIFGTVNLDIGPYTLLIPITVTGFALSFVFVPLATMTTSTISRNEMGNATGLFNMLRNIGGSIGIAMATTALIRRADLYQNNLAANLSPSSAVLQQKSAMIAHYLGHGSVRPAARPGSFGLIYGLMQQQAAMLAYVDVFRWTAILALICAAATWLFKKPAQAQRHRRPARTENGAILAGNELRTVWPVAFRGASSRCNRPALSSARSQAPCPAGEDRPVAAAGLQAAG